MASAGAGVHTRATSSLVLCVFGPQLSGSGEVRGAAACVDERFLARLTVGSIAAGCLLV